MMKQKRSVKPGSSTLQLEGRNPLLEAIYCGATVHRVLLDKGAKQKGKISQIISLCRQHNVPINKVDRRELDQMSQTGVHQGVIAIAQAPRPASLSQYLAELSDAEISPCFVILDEVQYEHNLGAVLRTAAGAGIDGLVIPKGRSAAITSTVARLSMGACFLVPVFQESLMNAIKILKEHGIWLFALDVDGEIPYFKQDLTGAVAFILGGEDKGVSSPLKAKCDLVLSIPMPGRVPSLNVSVCAAIIIFERLRQLSSPE